jgi:alanyl-tRNA synthetase
VAAPRTADELRTAFTDFFAARGHTVVPSSSLIPHDPSLMLTIAGMVQFKPYFVGDETPPYPRATSVQKVARAGGKDSDLDYVGRTNRHFSFFEMLGNFSFGDYFKAEVIPWAWELVTEVFELDPDRIWVTVHNTDDEAERIWTEVVGLPPERVQRLGDADNFWTMGDTGPCGPSSEIFYDLGPEFGPAGGPAKSEDRYLEIWNLVFMQFDAQADGELLPLPKPSIDTGAGLERNLTVLQGKSSAWDTDLLLPLAEAAARASGTTYGGFPGGERDLWLRILADHGRTMTFLIADGVVPSNEGRGYVLRAIIRRAVRHAYLLGAETQVVTPALVDATVEVMGRGYPELVSHHELVRSVVQREEERFRQTLARGLDLLDGILGEGDVTGSDAFFLHDTLGFPIDLTREIAEERNRAVDLDAFDALMNEQRTRAREAHAAAGGKGDGAPVELFRELLEELGPTEFTGRQEYETVAKVRALIAGGERVAQVAQGTPVDIVLDRTPFYAESGGQVGDTGVITTELAGADGVRVRVDDTQYGLPGLVLHRATVESGTISENDEVTARIDGERRDRIRRNHTATHVLHWALREVLGTQVKQAGSLVSPEYLRFDFSHHEALTRAQIDEVEALANAEIIGDAPVRHYETTKDHAESLGAIAFFGDKYGDLVRVLEAGEHSIELCGGTHVHALGFIGPIKITSEGSIGANLRRIFAVTGDTALARIHDEEVQLRALADSLKVSPAELPERVARLVGQVRDLQEELAAERSKQAGAEGVTLASTAVDGVVVARRDGFTGDELRQLAIATRDALGQGIVALAGLAPDGTKAGLVVAVTKDVVERGVSAADLARDAAKALGGGTAKNPELVQGGGPKVEAIDDALALLTAAAGGAAHA